MLFYLSIITNANCCLAVLFLYMSAATNKTVSLASSRTRDKKKMQTGWSVDRLPLFETNVVVDKQYTPDMFTGQHVSELVSENKHLKSKAMLI